MASLPKRVGIVAFTKRIYRRQPRMLLQFQKRFLLAYRLSDCAPVLVGYQQA